MWCVGAKALQKNTVEGTSFRGVVEAILVNCSLEDMIFFAGVARRLWLRCNDVVHGGMFMPPNTLAQKTQQAMTDYMMA